MKTVNSLREKAKKCVLNNLLTEICFQVQFVMMLAYLMFTLALDCRMPKALTYFFLTNVIIFIYLFSDFLPKSLH